MGVETGTHLEALTEATGAMAVIAVQDMIVGFGVWDVLAGVRVRMPRGSAEMGCSQRRPRGSISPVCANREAPHWRFLETGCPLKTSQKRRAEQSDRVRFRASRFFASASRHSPPRVRASRRVLRDGEEGEEREEVQEEQEVRAPHRPRPPPAPPPPSLLAFSFVCAKPPPLTTTPGFAVPSQDAQEETVAQRGLLLVFFLLLCVFRHRGQRGCAPPPRRQDGTRTSVQRDPRNDIEARSFSPTTRVRRRGRRPFAPEALFLDRV